MPADWTPLLLEAGIAAESLCAGLTALRKAGLGRPESYSHAFFGLSIGLERLAKLAILVDDKASPPFRYPTNQEFQHSYGHDLGKLFAEVDRRRAKYNERLNWDLPDRSLALTALGVLSEFAQYTRYYNLNLLTARHDPHSRRDPIVEWYDLVVTEILKKSYSPKRAQRDSSYAEFFDAALRDRAHIVFLAEGLPTLGPVRELERRAKHADVIQREGVVLVACLVRHMSELLFAIAFPGESDNDLPDLSEFFATFYCDERSLRRRKRFSTV